MILTSLISTRAQAQKAAQKVTSIETTLSDQGLLEALTAGLPHVMIEGLRRTLTAEQSNLSRQISLFENPGEVSSSELMDAVSEDLGLTLIAARLIKGISQKQLARELGKRPQEVQRWEASGYNSITLANFRRVQHVLGLNINATLKSKETAKPLSPSKEELRKVSRHAQKQGWFGLSEPENAEMAKNRLLEVVFDTKNSGASPALLRTGLSSSSESHSLTHLAWKARVAEIARNFFAKSSEPPEFDLNSFQWLTRLPQLSVHKDGISQAVEMVRSNGIAVVFERNIAGLKLDGASFLLDDKPVIGMTLRNDSIDNFWFTLLHELAHVYLHYHVGLQTGFFDELDDETRNVSKLEIEADKFAQELLIPSERWRTSTARLATSADPVEKFAKRLGINPAIVFGRIRYERKKYSLFSSKLGRGTVRPILLAEEAKK